MQSTSISKKNKKNFDGIVTLDQKDNINYKIIKNYSKTIFIAEEFLSQVKMLLEFNKKILKLIK